MTHNLRLGQVMLASQLHTKNGFERKDARGQFNATKGHLMAVLYLGQYSAESLEKFSPNAAIASLGYGPLLMSKTQLSLVSVIKQLRDRLDEPAERSAADQDLIDLADDALAAVAAFTEVAKKASP